jgi:hypothetical protein
VVGEIGIATFGGHVGGCHVGFGDYVIYLRCGDHVAASDGGELWPWVDVAESRRTKIAVSEVPALKVGLGKEPAKLSS